MFDTSTLTIVKSFSDGGALYFGEGAFDNWCVYKINANGTKQIPRDRDYFKEFVELCDKYDKDKLYADFLKIYDKTDKMLTINCSMKLVLYHKIIMKMHLL